MRQEVRNSQNYSVLPVESQGYEDVRDPFIGICLGEVVLAVTISIVVVGEPRQVVEVHC